MSEVLNRKLKEIQNAYTNLKIRMAGDNIWVYSNTPLNTAYTKLFCNEKGIAVPEEVESMVFDGLNIDVVTNFNHISYKVLENRSMFINGVLTQTDADYSKGLAEILKYSMASPKFMEALIDDSDFFKFICEDEDGANIICRYYAANLKYQSVLQHFNDAIDEMNAYCGKLDDEFLALVNQPLLSSVQNIMNDSASMFTGIGNKMSTMAASLDILLEQPGIIDYALDCKDAFNIFSDLLSSVDSVFKIIGENNSDKIFSKLPQLVEVKGIVGNYLNNYDFYLYNNGKSYTDLTFLKNASASTRSTFTSQMQDTDWYVHYYVGGGGASKSHKAYLIYPYPVDLTGVNYLKTKLSADRGITLCMSENINDFINDNVINADSKSYSFNVEQYNKPYYMAITFNGNTGAYTMNLEWKMTELYLTNK